MKRWLALFMAFGLLLCALPGQGEEYDDDSWLEEYAPYCRVEDDTLFIFDGVKALGQYDPDWFDGADGPEDETYLLSPEDAALFDPGLSFFDEYEDFTFSAVRFPSSLIYIGTEAFCFYHFRELTLPATIQRLFDYAFHACSFDTLRIEADLPLEQLFAGLDECRVRRYEVPEDHPRYKTIDGVLFTADGKTLLRYPLGRTDAHYDVPAGVECIGEQAFMDAEHLKTVSLPIGLKAVEDYAFCGCDVLQSIALPLTVNEIGEGVFDNCVSLELVSLPEGLTVNRVEEPGWAEYYPDSAIFRGDNGDTLTQEKNSGEVYHPSELCRLLRDGRPIPCYASPDAARAAVLLPNGTVVCTHERENGRVAITLPGQEDVEQWVSEAFVAFIPEDTYFTFADLTPVSGVEAWQGSPPLPGAETLGIPLALKQLQWHDYIQESWGYTYGELYGPFAVFRQNWRENGQEHKWQWFCRVQDADFRRVPDGTGNEYGIVFNQDDPYGTIPVLDEPDGQEIKALYGGDQIQILAREGEGYRVRVPLKEGWIAGSHVKIIEETEGEEEW